MTYSQRMIGRITALVWLHHQSPRGVSMLAGHSPAWLGRKLDAHDRPSRRIFLADVDLALEALGESPEVLDGPILVATDVVWLDRLADAPMHTASAPIPAGVRARLLVQHLVEECDEHVYMTSEGYHARMWLRRSMVQA